MGAGSLLLCAGACVGGPSLAAAELLAVDCAAPAAHPLLGLLSLARGAGAGPACLQGHSAETLSIDWRIKAIMTEVANASDWCLGRGTQDVQGPTVWVGPRHRAPPTGCPPASCQPVWMGLWTLTLHDSCAARQPSWRHNAGLPSARIHLQITDPPGRRFCLIAGQQGLQDSGTDLHAWSLVAHR